MASAGNTQLYPSAPFNGDSLIRAGAIDQWLYWSNDLLTQVIANAQPRDRLPGCMLNLKCVLDLNMPQSCFQNRMLPLLLRSAGRMACNAAESCASQEQQLPHCLQHAVPAPAKATPSHLSSLTGCSHRRQPAQLICKVVSKSWSSIWQTECFWLATIARWQTQWSMSGCGRQFSRCADSTVCSQQAYCGCFVQDLHPVSD